MKRKVVFLVKAALAVGLIVFLIRHQDIPFAELSRLKDRWPWFLAAQVPFGCVFLLTACRWKLLLEAQGIHYGFRQAMRLSLIGIFFNQVMPGSTGGDLVKAYYVARDHPDRRGAGILTVFLDRVLGLCVLLLVAGVAVFLNWGLVLESYATAIVAFCVSSQLGGSFLLHVEGVRFGVILAFLVATVWVGIATVVLAGTLFFSDTVRSHPWRRRLAERLPFRRLFELLAQTVYIYKQEPRRVLVAVVLSVGVHVGVVMANTCLFLALTGQLPHLMAFFLVVPLAQLIMAIPITPAAIGTAEAAYQVLFSFTNVSGFLISLLQRLTYYLWATAGLIFYLRRKGEIHAALSGGDTGPPSPESDVHEPGDPEERRGGGGDDAGDGTTEADIRAATRCSSIRGR